MYYPLCLVWKTATAEDLMWLRYLLTWVPTGKSN